MIKHLSASAQEKFVKKITCPSLPAGAHSVTRPIKPQKSADSFRHPRLEVLTG